MEHSHVCYYNSCQVDLLQPLSCGPRLTCENNKPNCLGSVLYLRVDMVHGRLCRTDMQQGGDFAHER